MKFVQIHVIFLMSQPFGPCVSKAIRLIKSTCFSVCRWNGVEWCEVLPAGVSVAHSCKVLPCGAVWLQQIIHLVTSGGKQHGKVSRPCLLRPSDGIEGQLLFLKWSCLLYATDTWTKVGDVEFLIFNWWDYLILFWPLEGQSRQKTWGQIMWVENIIYESFLPVFCLLCDSWRNNIPILYWVYI